MTPDAMKTHLTKLKVLDQYDISRPIPRPRVRMVNDYVQVAEILANPTGFTPSYAERAAKVINGKGYVANYSLVW